MSASTATGTAVSTTIRAIAKLVCMNFAAQLGHHEVGVRHEQGGSAGQDRALIRLGAGAATPGASAPTRMATTREEAST